MTRNVLPLRPKSPRDTWERKAVRRFRAARQALGWTQLTTAQRLGVSTTSIEDWERGAVRVPGWALVAIEALGVKEAA